MKPQIAAWLVLLSSARAECAENKPTRLIVANADGLIDVAAATQTEEPEPVPNPFRMRTHPASPTRDVPLAIHAILLGKRSAEASAVINGEVYSPGNTWEGLTVVSIGSDAIVLCRDQLLVRMPVQDQPVTLRLPR